jgi:hypothetical protein
MCCGVWSRLVGHSLHDLNVFYCQIERESWAEHNGAKTWDFTLFKLSITEYIKCLGLKWQTNQHPHKLLFGILFGSTHFDNVHVPISLVFSMIVLEVFKLYIPQFIKIQQGLWILGCANRDLGYFSKGLETLEVHCFNFKVSRTLLKKPQILICRPKVVL